MSQDLPPLQPNKILVKPKLAITFITSYHPYLQPPTVF